MVPAGLAHLRFPVGKTRGRRYPELPHPYRNDFQRDRDRIVYARAFRRLEDKTQVFAAGVSDHFRNRLTHTIEVAQIARTLAVTLGLDEDLTEALALAHDIGHPPFAHTGEEELNRLMRGYGECFDHNLHALRIVESFENPYARFPGLNLTFEVREGIVKHSSDAAPEEYLPGLRPPLEAQLVDLCDEIAYNTADLDDCYCAGLIPIETARDVDCFREIDDAVQMQFPGAPERVRMQEALRALLNWMVSALIEGTAAASEGLRDAEEVRTHPGRIAQFTPAAADATRQFKLLLRQRVYNSPALAQARRDSKGRVARLFEFFMADPDRMPAYYREAAASQPLHRQVCDYIAGMTDGFFDKTSTQMGL